MTQNRVRSIPGPRKSPVRVKLRRLGPEYGKLYPPDGEGKKWWEALKAALGTASSSFVAASLAQLQAAARLPDGPVSEPAINAALAIIQAAAPENEVEGALAVQIACTHCAAMAVLGRIGSAHGGYRSVSAYSGAAAKLLRAYSIQIEALRRLRGGGAQHFRVEHVHINDEARVRDPVMAPTISDASQPPVPNDQDRHGAGCVSLASAAKNNRLLANRSGYAVALSRKTET